MISIIKYILTIYNTAYGGTFGICSGIIIVITLFVLTATLIISIAILVTYVFDEIDRARRYNLGLEEKIAEMLKNERERDEQ